MASMANDFIFLLSVFTIPLILFFIWGTWNKRKIMLFIDSPPSPVLTPLGRRKRDALEIQMLIGIIVAAILVAYVGASLVVGHTIF